MIGPLDTDRPMKGETAMTVTHIALCHYCDTEITWTTAAWEPTDTEPPYDERGNYCCDPCYEITPC